MAADHSTGFLSLANQFFHWSLQRPSGGLLNIFFAPKGQGMFQINLKRERLASASQLLQSVVFGSAVDLPVSGALSERNLSPHATQAASNREGVIIWPLLITLFFTSTLLIILGWRFGHPKARSSRRIIAPGGERRILSYLEIGLLVSCVISELIAVTFLGLFFKESDETISILESSSENNSSLVAAVEALSVGLQTFLSSGLLTGQRTISKAFTELEDFITTHLQNRSDVVIDVVYHRLKVKETLTTQTEVVRLMDAHVAAMESDMVKMEAVSHFLTDLTSAERNLTLALRNECNHMERCDDLIRSLDNSTRQHASNPFRKDLLQKPITALHDFKVKLDPWFLLVLHLNESLSQVRSRLSNQTSTSTINLLPTVEAVWRQVEMQVNSLNQSVLSLEQEVVSSLNKTIKTSMTAVISSVCGVFVCLLLLLGVFVGGFLQVIVKERCLQKPRKFRKDTSACRLSVICLCAFLVITAVLLTVLIICTTFGSSFLYTEGCVYLQEDKYLSIFDAVLSGYMQDIWARIGGEMGFGLPPPTNLLSAAVRDCRRRGVGVFTLIGWSSFPDLPTLLYSENVQGVIQEERFDLTEALQQVLNELTGEATLSQLHDDLSKLILAHNNIRGVMEEFPPQWLDFVRIEEVCQHLPTLQLSVPGIAAAAELFIKISRRAPEMQTIMREIVSAAQALGALNDVEVMTRRFLLQVTNLAMALSTSSGLDNLFADVYTNTTWHLIQLCEPVMRTHVARLFPCHELPMHFSNLIDTVCGAEGLLARIYAWGVVVWIEMVLLLLFHLPLILSIVVVRGMLAETSD